MLISPYTQIKEQIDKLNVSHHVEILAVSKNQPVDAIENLLKEGVSLIGENRVQEASQKFPSLSGYLFEKHLIGSLQSNKINNALDLFDVFQSIESVSQLNIFVSKLKQKQLTKKFFFQVNTSLENSKHGVRQDKELFEMIEISIHNKQFINLQGLMTIGALSNDESIVRNSFEKLRLLKDEIQLKFSLSDLKLSMGMSNDFLWAIQEGSSMIRIGNKLFN